MMINMIKEQVSLLAKKAAEGEQYVITIGYPVEYKLARVECSDTVKQPARPFIDLAKLRHIGR